MDSWRVQENKDLWLRRLLPADMEQVVNSDGRAFINPVIAHEIQYILTIYYPIGSYLQCMGQQKTILPIIYYLLADDNQSSQICSGLTGLYTMAWAGKSVHWLDRFTIDPLYQGHKLGYYLLWTALELAVSWGDRLICIEIAFNHYTVLNPYHRMVSFTVVKYQAKEQQEKIC